MWPLLTLSLLLAYSVKGSLRKVKFKAISKKYTLKHDMNVTEYLRIEVERVKVAERGRGKKERVERERKAEERER